MKTVLTPRVRGVAILATIKWRLPMLQVWSVRPMIWNRKNSYFRLFFFKLRLDRPLFYSFLTCFIGYYRYVVKFHWLVSFATCPTRFDWLQTPGNRKGKLVQFWSCNSKIKQYKYRLLRLIVRWRQSNSTKGHLSTTVTLFGGQSTVADPGEGPGGPRPPLIFGPN